MSCFNAWIAVIVVGAANLLANARAATDLVGILLGTADIRRRFDDCRWFSRRSSAGRRAGG